MKSLLSCHLRPKEPTAMGSQTHTQIYTLSKQLLATLLAYISVQWWEKTTEAPLISLKGTTRVKVFLLWILPTD